MLLRFISQCFLVVLVISTLSLNAAAKTYNASDVTSFVNEVNNTIFSIMKNKTLSTQDKDKKLKKMLLSSVDIDWVAKFVLGKHWRTAGNNQKARYLKAYREYIIYTYLPRFREYKNQQVVLNKTIKVADNKYIVNTSLKEPEKADKELEYLIHKSKSGLQIYDFKVEGVSMINTQRADFNSVISRKNLNYFIARLENMVERGSMVASR